MEGLNSAPGKTRSSTRTTRKSRKVRENDECFPIVVEALPVDASPLLDHPIPKFQPSITVQFESLRSVIAIASPLQLFLSLFGEKSLDAIVEATNTKAQAFVPLVPSRKPRAWASLTRNELIVFLGTLFYMGRHYEYNRSYYWSQGMHEHMGTMGRTRWEQIWRFLSLNAAIDNDT